MRDVVVVQVRDSRQHLPGVQGQKIVPWSASG